MTLYVQGLRETLKALEQLGADADDLKDVFGPIGDKAAELIRARAPKKSGRMAKTIKGTRTKNKAAVRAGGKRVPYLAPLNYGWASRGIQPRRFMQAADDYYTADRLAEAVSEGLNDLIAKHGLQE